MRSILSLTTLMLAFILSPVLAQSGTDMMKLDYIFVGAHPDDEGGFTGTMARYNLEEGYQGSIAVFTLGQGGGNALGPEVGQSLGWIRYEELRRSLAIAGVDMFYYLGLDDFYFTQSADLTHNIWSEQNPEYLCELIRVVRLTKPGVIVTMWPGPGTHGHHQMAARAAIRAFDKSGDPEFCPSLITDEFLDPWEPSKLYLSAPGRSSISVPTDEFSRIHNMQWADVKGLALRNFRTQGWDRGNTVPAQRRGPESRILVRSNVPVGNPESHFLEGTHLPAGSSPVGTRMVVESDRYFVSTTGSVDITVELGNYTGHDFENTELILTVPDGWANGSNLVRIGTLADGENASHTFTLEPGANLTLNQQQEVWVTYTATYKGGNIKGENYAWIEPVSPLTVQVEPLFDMAQYRGFSAETNIEFLTPNLPTRVSLSAGLENEVTLTLRNEGSRTERGQFEFDLPSGISVNGDLGFEVDAGEEITKTVTITVSDNAFPSGEQSFSDQASVTAVSSNYRDTDHMMIYALPYLGIQRASGPITIDADLARISQYSEARILHTDSWSGTNTGPEDSSADFYLAYDEDYLYLGVQVYDDVVVCHMPPNRIRNHWYGDAIEITIDPSAESTDVSTTFRASIFPCSTEGFEPNAARYGDANSGAISNTAPGMEVASRQTDDGYIIETAIPWSAMQVQPETGDQIRFNLLVYDADEQDPEEGADYGKSRIGWGSSIGAQQATVYTWPLVTLEP